MEQARAEELLAESGRLRQRLRASDVARLPVLTALASTSIVHLSTAGESQPPDLKQRRWMVAPPALAADSYWRCAEPAAPQPAPAGQQVFADLGAGWQVRAAPRAAGMKLGVRRQPSWWTRFRTAGHTRCWGTGPGPTWWSRSRRRRSNGRSWRRREVGNRGRRHATTTSGAAVRDLVGWAARPAWSRAGGPQAPLRGGDAGRVGEHPARKVPAAWGRADVAGPCSAGGQGNTSHWAISAGGISTPRPDRVRRRRGQASPRRACGSTSATTPRLAQLRPRAA